MAISADYITLQRRIADDLGDRQDLLAPLAGSALTLSPIQAAIQSAVSKWERESFYFNEVYSSPLFTTVAGQEFYTDTDMIAVQTTLSVAGLSGDNSITVVSGAGFVNGQSINILRNDGTYRLRNNTTIVDNQMSFGGSLGGAASIGNAVYGLNDTKESPELYQVHVLVTGNRYPLTVRTWAELDVISVNPTSQGRPQDFSAYAGQMRLYPIPDAVYQIRASRTQRIAALSADTDSNVWTTDAFDLIRSEAKLILAQEVMQDDDLTTRMLRAIYGVPGTKTRGYLGSLKAETFRRGRARIIPSQF